MSAMCRMFPNIGFWPREGTSGYLHLRKTLEETTDKKLTSLAEGKINLRAAR